MSETIYSGETPGGAQYRITATHGASGLVLELEVPGRLKPTYTVGNIANGRLQFRGGELQLRPEAIEPLAAAISAAQAAHAARPEVQAAALRQQREDLFLRIVGCRDEIRARKDRAWERGDERRGVVDDPGWASKLAEAEAALAEFDQQHPEVLAEIKAERARRAEEGRWR